MMSFRNNKLETMSWSNETLKLIGRIQEYKGKQALFERQLPEILQALKDTAIIHSAESSNRIEGIIMSSKRLSSLVQNKVQPQTRSESEIAGYRDVLSTIHTSSEYISLKTGVILQLHRDLMQYATGAGGRFKINENEITETLPTGEEIIRFLTVPVWQTPSATDELVMSFLKEKEKGLINDLILLGAFILDFLSIHPFPDGNGRMARLLTLLLLYHTGYEVGRYISLEKIVEETKDQYYETLQHSSKGWHEGTHDLLPWINYFLVILLKAYQKFEERVGETSDTLRQKGWKAEKVKDVVNHMVADFSFLDLQERCPGISRPTIQRILNELSQSGIIECIERGRNARWRKL